MSKQKQQDLYNLKVKKRLRKYETNGGPEEQLTWTSEDYFSISLRPYLITGVVRLELPSSGSAHWATFHRGGATPGSPLIGWIGGGLLSPRTASDGCRRCTRRPPRSGARVGSAEWCAPAYCSYSALEGKVDYLCQFGLFLFFGQKPVNMLWTHSLCTKG